MHCVITKIVGTCLNLHSLAVCDWAHMPVVCVMIILFFPHYLKKNSKVPPPYLKCNGSVKKKAKFAKSPF